MPRTGEHLLKRPRYCTVERCSHATLLSFRSPTRSEAFDLNAALDAYEAACYQLVIQWKHVGLYAQAGAAIESIREYGVSVTPLTVLTLQLVIAHWELESALWRRWTIEQVSDQAFQEILGRHAIAVQDLRLAAQLMVPS